MTVTPAQTQKILQGNHKFSQLGFSLLVTRLKGIYSKDPSQAVLENCTNELNVYFEKYKAILTADLSLISQL